MRWIYVARLQHEFFYLDLKFSKGKATAIEMTNVLSNANNEMRRKKGAETDVSSAYIKLYCYLKIISYIIAEVETSI